MGERIRGLGGDGGENQRAWKRWGDNQRAWGRWA